ncbi:putative eukaryotic translation initiation factor 3 subunit 7 [Polychytrium aggregatum]|uniref:putative eukaryotic translation initiation factor 3 subunit 7 n=1 Tax=Polychytrium aggregatum TaxID=110093 RepID=UPI0022FDB2E0|nr:putative eukaryotic translation initiation factor 3 subunit 7 [Polychytrium aggregatum]KAI9204306.1 putative eukaryotic translation initiation factor 3 subunit 7 [Polychytrium aggregatum]
MVESSSKPRFVLPKVTDNSAGWGPSAESQSELADLPYAPFSKSDRLGKIADWGAPAQDGVLLDRRGNPVTEERSNRRTGRGQEVFGAGHAPLFAYAHSAEDDAAFAVVDRSTGLRKSTGLRSNRGGRGGAGRGSSFASNRNAGPGGKFSRGQGQTGGFQRKRYGFNDKPQRVRESSVKIGTEWTVVEEVDLARLSKLSYEVDEAEDICCYGALHYYDKSYDRVTVKADRKLHSIDRIYHNVTTSDDPVLQKIAQETEGSAVFATDNILSVLMCGPRSVYSWDMIIVKEGGKIFMDKRDGGCYDNFSVNENAAEPPLENAEKDSPNTPQALSEEATQIYHNFAHQCVKSSEAFTFENENPFAEAGDSDSLASAGYRYRKWDLGDDFSLIARTQIDAVMHQAGASNSNASQVEIGSSSYPQNETIFVSLKSLNEFDSKAPGAGGAPDWRQKLDSQRGAVIATEMKNNSNKLARWAVESVLSGVDQVRVGFVSRVNTKDRRRHTILGTSFFKPREFAAQMNFSMSNAWGILKTIVNLIANLDDGKYVIVKDANKPVIRLYSVPLETFEEVPEDADAEAEAEDL